MTRLPLSSSLQASRRLGVAGLCLLSALLPGLWDTPQATAQQSPRRVLRRLSPGGSGPTTYQFREIFEFPDSGGPVYSLAWSPDGSRLASAGGRDLLLWDPHALLRVATMSGHGSTIWGVAWSPDGNLLASASADGTVRLWDAHNHRQLATLETDWAMTVAWSPDGSLLASAHQNGSIWVWDPDTHEALRRLEAHDGWSRGVAFSPDGGLLLTSGEDDTATVWSTETWTRLASLPCGSLPVWSVGWSPDGSQFALGSGLYQGIGTGAVFLWQVIRE